MIDPLIVFLGPTGSGKTTQATRVAERLNIDRITTGDLVRARIANGELDEDAILDFNNGNFVYTDAVSNLVNTEISKYTYQGLILDGYPRTESQHRNLGLVLHQVGRLLTAVVYTGIDKEAARQRVLARNRSDDNEISFENRYSRFITFTLPLLDKLDREEKLIQVDGAGNIDQVTEEIVGNLVNCL